MHTYNRVPAGQKKKREGERVNWESVGIPSYNLVF